VWRRQGFLAFWRAGNFTFLCTLLAGILTSIALLARMIGWLLENHPVPVWAFFCGLILASIVMVLKPLQQRGVTQGVAFVIGTTLAALIALAPGLGAYPVSPLIFFLGGALAICAMILPGISGSFILLLLGLYPSVLAAVEQGDWPLLLAFMAGCACGLLAFVRLLKWLLARHHDTVMALLGGFMAGSLVKLWPWRLSVEGGVGDRWLWPAEYARAVQGSSELPAALVMTAVGLVLVWLLSFAAPGHNEVTETDE
jgi:putative membrane protein